MRPVVHILILAAGDSSRMRGRDKLVQLVDGKAILRRVAETALATGAPVTVTLPVTSPEREAALSGLPLARVAVPDAGLGMSRSLVRGVTAVQAGHSGAQDGIMVLPADMPGFTVQALGDLIACFADDPICIWRGADDRGQEGHPTIFPRDLWPDLAAVTGDEGGRTIIKAHRNRVRLLPLPSRMATLDLDTPEDWAAYLGHPI
jgi:molybdenum cofactor cytidylyltransferase